MAAAIGVSCGRPCGICRHGRAAGSRSGGPPPRRTSAPHAESYRGTSPRTSGGEGGARSAAADDAAGRPQRTSPRADGRAGVWPRTSGGEEEWPRQRPRDGHGDQRHVGGTSLRWPWDGRGISAPRGWPQGCVATNERRGGEGGRRSAAAEISAPRERPRGDVTAEAAGRPWESSPCADGRAGMSPRRGRVTATEISALRGRPRVVSPRTSGAEGSWSGGPPPRTRLAGLWGDIAAAAAGRPRGSAPRADGRGVVSPRTSGTEGRGSGAAATDGAPSGIGRRREPGAVAKAGIASRVFGYTRLGTSCLRELPWGPKGGVWRCESAQGAAAADEAPSGRGRRRRPSSSGRRP